MAGAAPPGGTVNATVAATLAIGVVTAVVAGAAFYLTTRAARTQSQAAIRGVDAGAFDRARQIYEGALDTLREELVACRAELATARSDLTSARNEIAGLRTDIAALKTEIAALRRE